MFDLENSPPRNKKFAEKNKKIPKRRCVLLKKLVLLLPNVAPPTLEVLAVEANSGGFLEDSSGWLVLCMYLKIGGSKKNILV